MVETKDLGLVKAIFEGTTPPTNTSVLWRDTNLTIPLLKQYNPTTSSWEPLIYFTLIDNITIKKDGDGKLYVDVATIPALQITDGSITLAKLVNFNSGTVLYRRSAGSGVIEATTLAQLKIDLGLEGVNTGDDDLSVFALKTYTVNGKALNGNITLTHTDIGSPAGSGNSTNTNTGDETKETILTKLEITTLSGNNTGDQSASQVPITDTLNYYVSTDVEGALAEVKLLADTTKTRVDKSIYNQKITLPAYTSVALRCSNAVSGTDYPTGWTLAAGDSEYDLKITHGLNKNLVDAKIYEINGDTTERLLPAFSAAYTGILQNSKNEILIEGLTQDNLALRIDLIFEQ